MCPWEVLFASLVLAVLRLVLSSDIVGDILVDLLCASASIEPVRQDLELKNVVHHCRNLVALRCVKLILLCWSPSLLQDLITFCGFRLPLASPLTS